MKSTAPDHPWLFFVLIYGLSVPFWILGTQITHSGLPDNLPVTDIGAALTPTIAAVILRYREVGAKRWLVAAALVFPLLYGLTYFAMRAMVYPVSTAWTPSPGLAGIFFSVLRSGHCGGTRLLRE